MTPVPRHIATLLALFATAPLFGANETIKSTTTPLSTDRLLVTTGGNWADNSAPLAGDDLFFNDISGGNRLVVHNSAGATVFSFNSLNFTQTSAFINRLDVRAPMTVANAITLAASAGGQTVLRVDTADLASNAGTNRLTTYAAQTSGASTALTVSSVTVDANASLVFARNLATSGTGIPIYVSGNVTVNNGGSFVVNRGFRPTPTLNATTNPGTNSNASTSVTYQVGGAVSLAPGATLSIATDNAGITDANSGAETELADTRLQINGNFTATGGSITSGNTGAADLGLAGATNSIAAGTNLNTTDLLLTTSTATNQSLNSGAALNGLGLVSSGNSIKTVTATAQVGNITFRQNTNASELTLKLGADLQLKTGSSLGVGTLGASGTGVTQAFTIDTSGFALDGSAAAIRFDNSNKDRTSHWTVTGGGSVSADTITFDAKADAGFTNSAPSLTVTAGTDLTAASFDATNVGTITLGVGGLADFARVSAPVQVFAGALVVNLTAAPAAGTYQLFHAAGGTGDFASVSITGTESVSLSGLNAWSGSSLDFNYTFSELSGLLTISSTAIPEPGTFAALAGLLGLGFAGLRRRRV